MLSTLCPCEKSVRNPRFIDLRLSIYPSFLLLVHILVHHTGTIQKLNLRYRVSRSDVRSWISFHEFNIPDAVACNADTNSHARYILSLFKSIIDLVIWYGKLVVWRNSRGREESGRNILSRNYTVRWSWAKGERKNGSLASIRNSVDDEDGGERGSCFIFMNSSPRRAIWRGPTSSPRPLLSDIKMITSRIIRGIGKFTVGPFSFRAVGPVSPFNERV